MSSQSVVCVIPAGLVLVVEVMIWVKAPIPIIIDLFTGFLYKSQPTFNSLLIYHLLHKVGVSGSLWNFGPLTREARRAVVLCHQNDASAHKVECLTVCTLYVVDR